MALGCEVTVVSVQRGVDEVQCGVTVSGLSAKGGSMESSVVFYGARSQRDGRVTCHLSVYCCTITATTVTAAATVTIATIATTAITAITANVSLH